MAQDGEDVAVAADGLLSPLSVSQKLTLAFALFLLPLGYVTAKLTEQDLRGSRLRMTRELREAALRVDRADERRVVRPEAIDIIGREADVRVDPHLFVEACGMRFARELATAEIDRGVTLPTPHRDPTSLEVEKAALALGLDVGRERNDGDAAGRHVRQWQANFGAAPLTRQPVEPHELNVVEPQYGLSEPGREAAGRWPCAHGPHVPSVRPGSLSSALLQS